MRASCMLPPVPVTEDWEIRVKKVDMVVSILGIYGPPIFMILKDVWRLSSLVSIFMRRLRAMIFFITPLHPHSLV